jgi:Uma2 family endonuclease
VPTTLTPPNATSPATYMADASIAKFSVARYQRMIESGIFTPEDKVELLETYVVLKMPRNPRHDGTIQRITKRLMRYVPAGWDLRVQLTLELRDSQPEPDLAVARGDENTYLTRHPTPADMGLVVEVADSSLLRDQRDKARIYARAAIACYWVVNLVDRQIEVHTAPSGPTAAPSYGSLIAYTAADAVPLVLDGTQVATVPVTDLLP